MPNPLANVRHQPMFLVQISVSSGPPRTLPFLNERTVDDLPKEVLELGGLWINGRGDDWQPAEPGEAEDDDELVELPIRAHLVFVLMRALFAAFIAVPIAAVISIVLLVLGVNAEQGVEPTFAEKWLGLWPLMAATFVIV